MKKQARKETIQGLPSSEPLAVKRIWRNLFTESVLFLSFSGGRLSG